jgi:transcriptional regulator with XRE-family HTH domain
MQQTDPSRLAERMQKLRMRRGWTWDEVARRLGVTAGAIRQWRLGRIKHVRPAVLRRIEELELSTELESRIVELDPEWRETLRKAKLSVERILLSRDPIAIEHLKSTLEVLQNYVEATEEQTRQHQSGKARAGPKRDREAD